MYSSFTVQPFEYLVSIMNESSVYFYFMSVYLEHLCSHPKMENNWTEFENAATYEHARNFVEEHYRFKDKITFST